MGSFGGYLLTEVYNDIDLFVIILIRILGFVILLPVLSGINIPNIIKIGFSVCVSLLIFSSELVTKVNYVDNFFGYGFLFVKEFFVGIIIGFVAYMFFTSLYLMGQLIDFQLGLSMVSVFDPVSQLQVPITGNLIYFVITLFFVQSGGLNSFINIIVKSYETLPAGEANLLFKGEIIDFFVFMLTESFSAGVKFSLPIVGSILLVDVALGILVKAVPQINVFVVGMPLKLLLGFMVLLIIIPMFSGIYDYIFNESYKNMLEIIQGLVKHET